MCKIAIIAGLDPKNKENNWEFVQELGALMSKGNSDGLGYTAVDIEGKIFGEHWLFNHEAFDIRNNMNKIIERYQGFLKGSAEPKYKSFGSITDEITAITLHTRMATGKIALENVHPFVDMEQDTSVIHNGVISNWEITDNIRSTCDSERILNQYLDKDVMKKPSMFQRMIDELTGYFACGIISRDDEGTRIIDVFRTRANLGAVFVKELNALVITTDVSLVYKVAKDFNFKILGKFDVEENMLLRLNAATGGVMLAQKYEDTALPTKTYTTRTYTSKWKEEEAVEYADDTLKKIGELVNEELASTSSRTKTYDPLNEEEANKDGYVRTQDNIWVQRKVLIN